MVLVLSLQKMVVTISVYDEGSTEKVMRTVASCSGITGITMDPKEGKLTVTGEFDELQVMKKLKRKWDSAKMASFGPFDAKKEAEAAEKKKKEESERERMEALYRSHRETPLCPIPIHHHHSTIVCDHDHQGCVIS
ncbi:PREDICTED: uncharacterized protein LOC104704017 [Camelina sativa]|uniref:Uncharacterized protein LOC104704017 n=1 Tax=Camelina sativa TaxID=90675 RepID=A0ABM1Q8H1_CAMSA|nr:PREDICTED: uncharacterized protein LOC104704017 [Camelina sativa]